MQPTHAIRRKIFQVSEKPIICNKGKSKAEGKLMKQAEADRKSNRGGGRVREMKEETDLNTRV